MRNKGTSKVLKATILLSLVCFVASSAVIYIHLNHEHYNEHCETCRHFESKTSLFSMVFTEMFYYFGLLAFLLFLNTFLVFAFSPVALKNRMNN